MRMGRAAQHFLGKKTRKSRDQGKSMGVWKDQLLWKEKLKWKRWKSEETGTW
jgi:hypothetical protein